MLRFSSQWLVWHWLAARRKLRLSVVVAVAAAAAARAAVARRAAAVARRAALARAAVVVVSIVVVAAARAALALAAARAAVATRAVVALPLRPLLLKLPRPLLLPRLLPSIVNRSDPQALCSISRRIPCYCWLISDEFDERLSRTAGSAFLLFLRHPGHPTAIPRARSSGTLTAGRPAIQHVAKKQRCIFAPSAVACPTL